jgi:hypothetical protein
MGWRMKDEGSENQAADEDDHARNVDSERHGREGSKHELGLAWVIRAARELLVALMTMVVRVVVMMIVMLVMVFVMVVAAAPGIDHVPVIVARAGSKAAHRRC